MYFLQLLINWADIAWKKVKELKILFRLANKILESLKIYLSAWLKIHFFIYEFCHKIWGLFRHDLRLFIFNIAHNLKKLINVLVVKGSLIVLANEVKNKPVFLFFKFHRKILIIFSWSQWNPKPHFYLDHIFQRFFNLFFCLFIFKLNVKIKSSSIRNGFPLVISLYWIKYWLRS